MEYLFFLRKNIESKSLLKMMSIKNYSKNFHDVLEYLKIAIELSTLVYTTFII